MIKSIDTIGNRTRDLPACSAVLDSLTAEQIAKQPYLPSLKKINFETQTAVWMKSTQIIQQAVLITPPQSDQCYHHHEARTKSLILRLIIIELISKKCHVVI